jgi:hypothetical protein
MSQGSSNSRSGFVGGSLRVLKETLARLAIAIVCLAILSSALSLSQTVKGQGQTLSISPGQGPVGTTVAVSGTGFVTTATITINFGPTAVATTFASDGIINSEFTVPSVPPGQYIVTAMDLADFSMQHNAGLSAEATFTVTSGSSSSTQAPTPLPTIVSSSTQAPPAVTSAPSSSGNPRLSTYQPTTGSSGGFWSPLTISLIAAALIAFSVSAGLLYSRRGKEKTMLEEKPPPYSRGQAAASSVSSSYAGYDQSIRSSQQPSVTRNGPPQSSGYSKQSPSPPMTERLNQPSSYSQPGHYTKTCPRCKKVVRDDQNICPYCDKRLR